MLPTIEALCPGLASHAVWRLPRSQSTSPTAGASIISCLCHLFIPNSWPFSPRPLSGNGLCHQPVPSSSSPSDDRRLHAPPFVDTVRDVPIGRPYAARGSAAFSSVPTPPSHSVQSPPCPQTKLHSTTLPPPAVTARGHGDWALRAGGIVKLCRSLIKGAREVEATKNAGLVKDSAELLASAFIVVAYICSVLSGFVYK